MTNVLKDNLRNIGRAATMIENGDFALQDSSTNMDIDLKQPWEVCFTPGQVVFMSMVFKKESEKTEQCCPRCSSTDNDDKLNEDIEW